MCSFEIKSLFTAVPLEKTINNCAKHLFDITGLVLSLMKNNFTKLIQLATNLVEFSTNNQMYQQLNGVVKGSTLRPTLATVLVGSRETLVLGKLSKLLFYCRYVDDCLRFSIQKMKVPSFIVTLINCTPRYSLHLRVKKTIRFRTWRLW